MEKYKVEIVKKNLNFLCNLENRAVKRFCNFHKHFFFVNSSFELKGEYINIVISYVIYLL